MGKTAMRARFGANEAYDETLQDTYEMNRPPTGEINFKSKPYNPKLKSARPKTGLKSARPKTGEIKSR
jgi:hypothetical protein